MRKRDALYEEKITSTTINKRKAHTCIYAQTKALIYTQQRKHKDIKAEKVRERGSR